MAGELGYDTGPFLTAAVFCDYALQEKDGVLSIVRIIDQITVQASGPEVPDDLPPGAAQLVTTLVVALKPGEARGRQTLRVDMEHPDGTVRQGPDQPIHFTGGPTMGIQAVIKMQIALSGAGTYYALVMVNGRLMTRSPLEIRYEPHAI